MVAGVVEHAHGRFVGGHHLDEMVQEGQERVLPFARAGLPEDLPAGVVDRAKDRQLVVVARGGHCQRLPLAPPDLCQGGVGMDFALVPRVHVDQMEALSSGSFGRSNRFFWSHSKTCWAAATAARSCRWVRSWRGRRATKPSACTTRGTVTTLTAMPRSRCSSAWRSRRVQTVTGSPYACGPRSRASSTQARSSAVSLGGRPPRDRSASPSRPALTKRSCQTWTRYADVWNSRATLASV